MPYRINYVVVCTLLMSLWVSGCVSTTASDHARRNAHVSMQELLGEPPTAEKRQVMAQKSVLLASEAHKTNEYKLALRHAFGAIQNDPDNIRARKIHADSLLQLGNYTEAEKGFKALLSIAPDEDSYIGYGLSLIKQDRTGDGRDALTTAIEINPKLWRAWDGIGQSYVMEGDWPKAEESYQKALAIDPNQPEIHNNIGLSLIAQDRAAEAQAAFAKAKSMPEGNAIADNNHRLALALNGNTDQAFMGLGDVQRAELYNTLGQTALRHDNKSAAIEYFKKAISYYPSHYHEAAINLETALIAR